MATFNDIKRICKEYGVEIAHVNGEDILWECCGFFVISQDWVDAVGGG